MLLLLNDGKDATDVPCESVPAPNGLLKIDEEPSPKVLLPELAAPNAARVGFELLEPPEIASMLALGFRSATSVMVAVDAAETAVGRPTEAPNLKTGPPELVGFAPNPKMLLLEVAEVLAPTGTESAAPLEEANRRAPPRDVVSLEEATGAAGASGPFDVAEGATSDFPFISPALFT